MVDERKHHILELLVREYIKTAEPVSSGKIARKIGSISPATVRNIFTELTDEGYIEQPHTSGGRIPRERAYRFFVDRILDEEISVDVSRKFARIISHVHRMEELQERMARAFHVLFGFGELMPAGFDEIFQEPEFAEPALVRELGKFLDGFDECRDEYESSLIPDSFEVMIGQENTVQPMKHMTLIVGKDTQDEIFFMVGPTRMKYDHIIGAMKLWNKNPQRRN